MSGTVLKIRTLSRVVTAVLSLLPYLGDAQETDSLPTHLPNAHAHNDYLHRRPLEDALANGFASVEADVFAVKGELYLGHIRPRKSAKRTLRHRYLEPLHRRMEANGGRVYPGYEGVVFLMIDFKTDGAVALSVLNRQLEDYPLFRNNPYCKIFISGNRPALQILADTDGGPALDGRTGDIGNGISSERMPVVSSSYKSLFSWNGRGEMPESERAQLRQLANVVHQEGKLLRLWAIPDCPNAWAELLDAGVDLINTDDVKGLRDFLTGQTKLTPGR